MYDQSKADHDRAANLNELYNSTRVKKKLETDKKKVESCERRYRKAVEKQQQLEAKMFDTEMPQIMSEFQEMERTRVDTIRTALESFSKTYLEFLPGLESVCSNMNQHVQSIDSSSDIRQFITDKRTGKDKNHQRTEFEAYNPQYKSCLREGSLGSVGSANSSPALERAGARSSVVLPSQGSLSNLGNVPQQENYRASGQFAPPQEQVPLAYAPVNVAPPEPQRVIQQPQAQVIAPVAPAPVAAPAAPAVIGYCRGLHDYAGGQPSELSFK